MALNAYLKFGDINGESTASGYVKWIELESWSWGVSRSEDSPPEIQSFSFTAELGAHSALLLGTLLTSKVTSTGALAVVGSSLGITKVSPVELKCSFTNLLLTVYDVGEVVPEPTHEQVSFAFERMSFTTGDNTANVSPILPG